MDGWERPVYFAVTVSPDGRLDLENYLQLEGQAMRVVPIRHDDPLGRVELGITPERLKTFRFRNLNNPEVYYDANIRRMVDNYRNIFAQTAATLVQEGQVDEGLGLMDHLLEQIPFTTIPGDYVSFIYTARVYQEAGDYAKALEILKQSEPLLMYRLDLNNTQGFDDYVFTFLQTIRAAYLQAGDFEGAAAFENKIRESVGEEGNVTAEEMRAAAMGMFDQDSLDGTQNMDQSTPAGFRTSGSRIREWGSAALGQQFLNMSFQFQEHDFERIGRTLGAEPIRKDRVVCYEIKNEDLGQIVKLEISVDVEFPRGPQRRNPRPHHHRRNDQLSAPPGGVHRAGGRGRFPGGHFLCERSQCGECSRGTGDRLVPGLFQL